MSERFTFRVAVYWLIRDKEGKILIMKRWENLPSAPWMYQMPAGNVDWGETLFNSLKREMKEELCIDIKEEDTEHVHTFHVTLQNWIEYLNLLFEIKDYEWKIQIWEPDKCESLWFYQLWELECLNLMKNDRVALENLAKWKRISEIKI